MTIINNKTSYLSGRFVNTDLQYPQVEYSSLVNKRKPAETVDLWKNDTTYSQISLTSHQSSINDIEIEIDQFKSNRGDIFRGKLEYYFIDSTQAYSNLPVAAMYGKNDQPPLGHRKESNEILSQYSKMNMSAESLLNIWVDITSTTDTLPGVYQGNIHIHTKLKKKALTFPLTIEVQDILLPDTSTLKESFDIELWQNPYIVAEYYGVDPFSEEHFSILKPHMQMYKKAGGQAITTTISEDAWNGQTYSKRETKYPSMVKWMRRTDGTFDFDYTDFDRWVNFNLDLGLGSKIVSYSIVPWNNQVSYFNEETNQQEVIKYKIGDESYLKLWEPFLESFVDHTTENGWFDKIYIGIDEQGFHQAAFDLIAKSRNKKGKQFKVAGAMDNIQHNKEWTMLIDDLTVGTLPVKEMESYFSELCEIRKEKGLKTTIYSCTGHVPGNFSLSAPGESFWTILFAYVSGSDGFLRWAYDSWVEEPLVDASHRLFEAGDCFVIYPGDKNDVTPTPRSSTRFEKISEGIRAVNKLKILLKNNPIATQEFKSIKANVKHNYSNTAFYLDHQGKLELASDMDNIRKMIKRLSKETLENKKNKILDGGS